MPTIHTEHLIPRDKAFQVLTAGKAEFSIRNTETGNHFTFKLTQIEDKPDLYFVKIAYDYLEFQYAGLLVISPTDIQYRQGKKGHVSPDAQSIRALVYVIQRLRRKTLPEQVELFHFGHCAACGRTLTNPESIELGIGPECAKKGGYVC